VATRDEWHEAEWQMSQSVSPLDFLEEDPSVLFADNCVC
jgi:hypothetical protein